MKGNEVCEGMDIADFMDDRVCLAPLREDPILHSRDSIHLRHVWTWCSDVNGVMEFSVLRTEKVEARFVTNGANSCNVWLK